MEQNSENQNILQNLESLIKSCVLNVCNAGDQNRFEFKISFGSEQDLRVINQNCHATFLTNKMNKNHVEFIQIKVRLVFPFFFKFNQISVNESSKIFKIHLFGWSTKINFFMMIFNLQ